MRANVRREPIKKSALDGCRVQTLLGVKGRIASLAHRTKVSACTTIKGRAVAARGSQEPNEGKRRIKPYTENYGVNKGVRLKK